jgi:hypothetical protein
LSAQDKAATDKARAQIRAILMDKPLFSDESHKKRAIPALFLHSNHPNPDAAKGGEVELPNPGAHGWAPCGRANSG